MNNQILFYVCCLVILIFFVVFYNKTKQISDKSIIPSIQDALSH
jgi:hypothetical protein